MKFSKVREVRSPSRANHNDAGIDFFVPENSQSLHHDLIEKNNELFFQFYNSGIILKPHCRILIPSGIKVNVPTGNALIAFNKSGVSSKKGLDLLASVVDESYQGEIHISVYNTSDDDILIEYGSKIIQFILLPVNYDIPEEVDINNLYSEVSSRGEGGFGSTGR